MLKQTMAGLAMLAMIGCGKAEPRIGAERVTLAPETDANLDYAFAKDGRLALSKIVTGKSAIFVANTNGSGARRVSFGVFDNRPMWSPDGKWIAFRRDAGQQNDVVIVPSDSGQEQIVAGTSANEDLRGWLADGSGLVFGRAETRGFQPWVYRLADRTSVRLFELDGSVEVVPSPGGTSVAYTLRKDGKSTLWLYDLASKAHRQLTTEGFERAEFDCFSPDGKAIVYESRRTGTADLWRLELATGERRQLTSDVANDVSARWSPDGLRIVFSSNRGGQPDLWVLATGEADVQRVTDDAFEELNAAWTPDGRGIVARTLRAHSHLFRIPTSGGAAAPLTSGDWDVGDFASVGNVKLAEVSGDGSRVAFAGNKNGDLDIWVVPTAGGEPRLISGAPGYDGRPSWSPDGTRIAFESVRSGNADIWIAGADSATAAAPRQLTDWPSGEYNAMWSPDGRTIAFLSNRESPGFDIWTMPAMGGAARRLTTFGTVAVDMAWSHDGRTIVFSAQVDASGGKESFSVPAGGGEARPIAPATSAVLRWSPDGRELATTHCTEGYCSIEIRSPEGKLLRTLTTGDVVFEYEVFWSGDGSHVLVASQDLNGLAFNRVDIRSATTSGFGRILPGPAGSSVVPIGFGPGDTTAIVIAGPGAAALQRIAVPAPIKAP